MRDERPHMGCKGFERGKDESNQILYMFRQWKIRELLKVSILTSFLLWV